MTKADILHFLSEHKEELHQRYGLTKIGLYGSYANGTSTEMSDIDIYAEFEEKKFKYIAGAWNYLEQNLEKKVDLFYPHKNMRKALRDSIEDEIIYG
jgi:hypothetical protein